ncbi:HNH endonuclease [Streptomyces sp. Amel2xB2]|uniref:HNH endonuclease n=1 Tax=Streptomyces sp. Amel2xB2 TaxID=1305829 RepID=UPI000DBFEEF2|nr:HNH endonuclease signature motif containing protein [Streptomyces sp. Amel2xB2]RAJ69738.1 HNH endonuclease [Streptomyces sp. Amel2xB2]
MPVRDIQALRSAVVGSVSLAGVLRALGLPQSGHVQARVKESIKAQGLSTAHFTGQGHNRGRPAANRKTADEILRRLPGDAPRPKRPQLVRALEEKGVEYECRLCGTGPVWRGKRLVLEIDHVNGDPRDNRLGNLRYLCPSCHSQTATHSRPRKGARR